MSSPHGQPVHAPAPAAQALKTSTSPRAQLVALATQGAYVLLLDRETGEPLCEPTRAPNVIAQAWDANRHYRPRPAIAATKRGAAVQPPEGFEPWWPPPNWRPTRPTPSPALTTTTTDGQNQSATTKRPPSRPAGPPTPPHDPPSREALRRRLDRDEHGRVFGSDKNAVLVLRTLPEWQVLRYNERSARFELSATPPVSHEFLVGGTYPRELCDEDLTSVRVALLEAGWGNYSAQVVSRALRLVSKQRPYDPVRSYLEGLQWDGTPRLDTWLFQYLGACIPDHPLGDALVRAIGAKWMLSAVARTFEPGCQVDYVLVLEGPQGVRKSSALRTLAGAEHFIDEVGKIGDAKNTGEVLQGAWIAEIGERAALKLADGDVAKSWITRREDRYRAAYDRTALSRPRRCVFAATTNALQYLEDETGNRRYWPIRVTRAALDALRRDRDQLWAEAVHRYRRGELRWLLDDDPLMQAIEQEQDVRRTTDPWEPLLARYCATHHEVTIGELLAGPLDKPKGQWTDGDQKRIARVLTAWHWQRRQRRIGGHREWYYHPPTGDTGDATGDASTA